VEPRTFTYTPASAHRAALAWLKPILPPLAIQVVAVAVWGNRVTVIVELLACATGAAVVGFFVLRQHFSTTKYAVTTGAITAGGQTLDRSQVTHLEVTPAYLTLRAANRRPIRVRAELDDYPVLLDILRGWNPPKIMYRDIDVGRLALAYSPAAITVALLAYL
jgi:hypothetical protein